MLLAVRQQPWAPPRGKSNLTKKPKLLFISSTTYRLCPVEIGPVVPEINQNKQIEKKSILFM